MWCAVYCVCLLVVGYGAVGVLMPRDGESAALRFGFAACLGPGVTGLGLIAFSLLGCAPGRLLIFCLTAPFAALIGIYRERLRISAVSIKPYVTWFNLICLVAIAYGIFVVVRDAVAVPVIVGDAFSIWQLKAKVLAAHPLFPRPDYFFDVALSYSHLRYPVLVPMISGGVHAMTGRLDDGWEKTPFVLSYIGLGAAVFGAVRRWGTIAAGLAASAALMTAPMALAHAANGTGDMSLTAFYGCSLISILRWQESRRACDFALAFLFTLCMAWSKNEGLPLALLNAAAMFVAVPHPWRWRAIPFAIGLAVLYLPWIIYSRDFPRTDEDYASHFKLAEISAHLNRLPFILGHMASDLWDFRLWGIFWFLPMAAVGVNPTRSRPILLLWGLLLCHLAVYIPPYIVTPLDLEYLMKYSVSRLMLHAAPAAALIVGLQFSDRSEGHLP